MLPILMALAAGTAGQALEANPANTQQVFLHTPDSIAPAVMPYLACLYAERGLPFLKGSDGGQIAFDKGDSDCSATKSRAEADAIKLIANKPIPGGASPVQYVQAALADMEVYVASLPLRQNGDKTGSAVGLPITLEDEVKPAYEHYQNCLKTQAAYTTVTVDTVVSTFEQAMKVCRSVRDSAVEEAQKALAKKGWDAATCAKAAESTFATIDRSWLAMAQQFRESIAARSRL
jgi:hypothetical protein